VSSPKGDINFKKLQVIFYSAKNGLYQSTYRLQYLGGIVIGDIYCTMYIKAKPDICISCTAGQSKIKSIFN
jgi:hypothetical protein